MPEDWMEKQEAWLKQNPLRRFRETKSLTYLKTASFLGVSITAIQAWESGTNKPTDENMGNISKLTSNESISNDWIAWLEKRPCVG